MEDNKTYVCQLGKPLASKGRNDVLSVSASIDYDETLRFSMGMATNTLLFSCLLSKSRNYGSN